MKSNFHLKNSTSEEFRVQLYHCILVEGDLDEVEGVDVGEGGEAPQSNMVLRKRIKRIRAGMKKYNTQLDEVKRFDQ